MAKKKKSFSSFVNNPIDFTLLITILLLLSIGLVMVLSASSPSALSETGNSYSFFSKQLLFAVIGIVAMLFISKVDYRFYQKFYKQSWWIALALLLLVLVAGKTINGAKRWIYITDTLSVQPSEIVKLLMIIFYAGVLVKNRDDLGKYGKGFIKHIIFLAPIIGLLLLEPHFSASIVIVTIVSVMMIIAGCKFWHFLATGGTVGLAGVILLIIKEPYRLQRVVTFLDPWKDATGNGWQVIQSLYAIGSGGLFGAGLGESKQKYLYIPEPHNDFIFSILGEELGFIGCAVVLILFAIFIWRGILIAMKAPDMFGSLMAIGITTLVAIQVIINVAVVTSSMPATGMPLPFFSYRRNGVTYTSVRNGSIVKYIKSNSKTIKGEKFMKVIIAAAGTAGHINPGLAIANKIKEEEKDSEIMFIGTTRGLENDLVPRSGYKLKTIDAYGLSKEISIENFKKMCKTLKGFGEAKKIIKEFKPDIVIGTGGYICGATISAAHSLKIPTLLHESNAFPGKAIKMLAGKTDTILVSFKDAKERIKKGAHVVFTGTPVKIKKIEYSENQKQDIINKEGLTSEKPIILAFGGSQGAKKINEAIVEIIKNKSNNNYQLIWAVGPKQYESIKEELKTSNIDIENIPGVKAHPYIYNMEELMNIVDVIVSRSGAMTITEISNLGKPSILIPLPNVSHNHQLYNAKVLENVEAAKIITNDELDGKKLDTTIKEIISSKERINQMGKNALKVSTSNVEDKIYSEIKKLVSRG